MPTVTVNLFPAYDVIVEPGLITRAGEQVRHRFPKSPKVAVVMDEKVATLHGNTLLQSLRSAGFECTTATIDCREQTKRLETLLPVFDTLLAAGIDRNTPLIALGGGILTDMAGFIAATLLRGVPLVSIPTSLLAMVDASVGGKTGVNSAVGKNLIGAFHQASTVLIDPLVLQTLPADQLREGLAECIKHDCIRDARHLAQMPSLITRVLMRDIEACAELVAHNVAIKARVVEADPFEKGERAHLNFGHTFAHAIEAVSNHSITHGSAVALGICAAAKLSKLAGLLPANDVAQVVATVSTAGLPVTTAGLDPSALLAAMSHDKKVQHGQLRFVLLNGLGAATVRSDIDESRVREALAFILKGVA